MFIFLSKLLPPLVYPLGLSCLLIILAMATYKHIQWQRLLLILAVVLLWASSTRLVSFALVRSLEWRYLPPPELSANQPGAAAEVIVLLGGATDSALYPRQTAEVNGAGDRVIYAAYLYKHGKASHILVSSGSIEWMGAEESPANDMQQLLEMLGVPREAVWLEDTSLNTYENAVNCKKILAEKDIQRIILVTSAMHMPRSVALFEAQGLEVIPAPTDYNVTAAHWKTLSAPNLATQLINILPSADNLATVTAALKEYIGLIVYRLRGWI